jgi:hypothetical protein
MVLSADKERRRISLSLRQLHGGPPEGTEEYVPPAYEFPEDDDDDEAETPQAKEDPVAAGESDEIAPEDSETVPADDAEVGPEAEVAPAEDAEDSEVEEPVS